MTVQEPKTKGALETDAVVRPLQKSAEYEVRICLTDELHRYEAELRELASKTIAPNVFYEPWMLTPAIEHAAEKSNLRFVLILASADRKGKQAVCGFFPLEIQKSCMKMPLRALAFWQHRWCYLTTPLVDPGHIWKVLDAFWRWFETGPFGCHLLDTGQLLADGQFHAIWADFAIGRSSFLLGDHPRAHLEPKGAAAEYFTGAISKKHLDEYLRLERRLSEIGKIEYVEVESLAQVEPWIEEFLRLESSGWKGGPEGRAFGKNDADAAYFRQVTLDGFLDTRVTLMSLLLDGKPIAMKHNLCSGSGGFAFRIAHEESYSKYSPGVLLELQNIRRVCGDGPTRWMDSCAAPRHAMANRLWSERRMIRRTLFSDGSRTGDLWVALLPLLRWCKKQIRPEAVAAHLEISTKRRSSGGK